MKIKFSKETYPLYIITLLGLALLTYTSVRAGMLSFTHDESNTFLRHFPESFMQIVSYHQPKANNHIINTLLIKYTLKIFPDTDFFIRLPNLIAHGIYILFSILILKRFRNSILIIGGFVLINFNPYLLDFFSLARGYGLALGFMLISIHLLLKNIESKQKKYIYWSYLFASLAVLSHFVYLHFYVTVIAIFNLVHFNEFAAKGLTIKQKFNRFLKTNIPTTIISTLLIFILFEPIRKLSKFNELYGHGNNSFFRDTIISFVNGSNYGKNYSQQFVETASIILLVLIIIIFITGIFDLKNKNYQFKKSLLSISFALLLLPALSSILQHHILGDEYLSYRLTLLFVPILGLSIVSFFDFFINSKYKIPASILLMLISGSMFFHTINAANFKYFSEWKYDANTKNMILELEKVVPEKTKNQTVKLGINWLFEPTINFYRQTRNLDWLEKVTREGIDDNYDYLYVLKDQLPDIENAAIIKEYEISQSVLLKKE